jgi:hypothetical protein
VQVLHPNYQPLQRTVTVAGSGTTQLAINIAETGKKKQ